jgi:hypothetical protein
MSQYHYLADEEINASVSDKSLTLRACLLDTHSKYLVLAIPENSSLFDSSSTAVLVNTLCEIGTMPKLYKASDSQGVQIFLSFSEPAKTAEMVESISDYLTARGFAPTADQLIIHSTEIPFSIPLQPGFSWLNDSLESKLSRDDISTAAAKAMFLHDLETTAVCPTQIMEAIKNSASLLPEKTISPETVKAFCETAICDLSDVQDVSDQPTDSEVEISTPMESTIAPELEGREDTLSADSTEHLNGAHVKVPSLSEGTQLLLFPIIPNGVSALPKGRPKREKRARSNLPDSSETSDSDPNNLFSTPFLADLATALETKEDIQNTS